MEMLSVVDGILKLAPVRWGLLVATMALGVSVAVQTVRFIASENQLDGEKGRNASLSAAIGLQNEAVKQAGRSMEEAKKKAREARGMAEKTKRDYEKRVERLRNWKPTGACPDMVQQVLDEVRK